MGGAASEVGEATTDVVVESAIFDPVSIRRTAFRYALRSEASLRFEKGQEFRLARVGADRTARLIAEWAGGQVAPGVVDSESGRAGAGARRVPAGPRQPAARHRRSTPTSSGRCSRGSGSRPSRPRAGTRIRVAAGHASRSTSRPAGPTSSRRSSRPGGATSRSRPTSPRRSSASAATTLVPPTLPDTPMPPYRHDPLALRERVRDTLVGAGLTEVVTFALVAPKLDRAVSGARRRRARGRAGAARRRPPGRRHEPAVEPALGAAPEPRRQPARGRLDEPAGRPRRRRDLRGRQGLRRDRRRRRRTSGGVSASRSTGAAQPAGLGPAGARLRPRRREGRPRADLPAARLPGAASTRRIDDDPNLHPGRAARVDGRRPARRPGRRAPSRDSSPRSTCAPSGSTSPRSRSRASPAGDRPTARVTAPSRHLPVERDLAVIVAADRPAAEVEAAIRRHGGPLLRGVELFDIYRGPPLAETENSLAYRLILRRRRADADRRRARRRRRRRRRRA